MIATAIGAIGGYQIGGPPWALAGFLLGYSFDSVLRAKMQQRRATAMEKQQIAGYFNEVFLGGTMSLLAKMAKADGRITKAEIAVVEHLMRDVLKLKRRARKEAIRIFNAAKSSNVSFHMCVVKYCEAFASKPEILDAMIRMLFEVAVADGPLSQPEERLIKSAAELFNTDPAYYMALQQRYVTQDTEQCYQILGCTKTDSMEMIKEKYRKLASQFHPDKIISKELPDEFIHFASQKFRDIQDAYETIKEERGAA